MMKHIGAEHDLKHQPSISCNKLHNGTDVVFWFGANNITLSSRDYIRADEYGCFVIFQESYYIDLWQFSTQILQHTFDVDQRFYQDEDEAYTNTVDEEIEFSHDAKEEKHAELKLQ
uniref:Gelsolin n=1 Tax=Ditylenchus dipsaci TaxID=166011 RepID=A0A915DJW8_9BILA